MLKGISIIICCFNSSSKIKQTLFHVAKQKLPPNIACELIIVDNASDDDTANFATNEWSALNAREISFKVVVEPAKGLANARKKGIKEATYEYLIFCDDDNWLDEYYVQNVFNLFSLNTNVAILGGIGIAQFENTLSKPIWFDKLYHGYAVGPQAANEGLVNSVYGAGMAIRKSVYIECLTKFPLLLIGRKENQLTAGDDSEICLRAQLAGYKIYYSPKLTFNHFIINRRLTWDYLKKLHTGFAKTFVIINLYQTALNSDMIKLPLFFWLKKTLYYWGIYIKYWPKHYKAYYNNEGTIEEIHHLTWKCIAIDYLKYNFKVNKLYKKIINFKQPELIQDLENARY